MIPLMGESSEFHIFFEMDSEHFNFLKKQNFSWMAILLLYIMMDRIMAVTLWKE